MATKCCATLLLLAWVLTSAYAGQACDHCIDPNDPSKGCQAGWFPASTPSPCSSECPDACRTCEAIDFCFDCNDGFSLVDRLCCYSDNCSACTANGTCSSCKDGFYGDACENQCNQFCFDRSGEWACDNPDGACYRCDIGFYGTHCENNCSSNCSRGCNKTSGECDVSSELSLPDLSFYQAMLAICIGLFCVILVSLFRIRLREYVKTCMRKASTGNRQGVPLNTLGHETEGNSAINANESADEVEVGLLEESSNQNIEVVSDLQLYKDRLLSKGRGTPVYEGVFEGSISVAVKKIHLPGPQYTDDLKDHVKILRQVENLRKLPEHSHQSVVRYVKSVQTVDFLYIAFELCQGTLEDYVDPQTSWSDELPLKHALTQMAKGLQFLHVTVNMAHRDLKPSNVLLCKSTLDTKIVLADFGQSKMMTNLQCSITGATGSLGWIAPEVWTPSQSDTTQNRYYHDSDIFSLGCLFYFVATRGHHPFGQDPGQRQTNIAQTKSDLSVLQPYLGCLRELITDMIQFNHENRPSAELVSEHPSLMADEVVMDFLHKASNRINGYPLSQQNILEDPTIIPGGNWLHLLPVNAQAHLSTYTQPRQKQPMFKGREGSVRHLLRAIRNCSEHFPALPAAVRAEMGASTPDHVQFWLGLYPWLLTHVYDNMKSDKSLMDSIRKT